VVVASAWTGAAIAEAVGIALKEKVRLQTAAAANANRFRSEQSVETFWSRLIAALPDVRQAAA
jgi:hypothetical protein